MDGRGRFCFRRRWLASRLPHPVSGRGNGSLQFSPKEQTMMLKKSALNCTVLAIATTLSTAAIAADDDWQARVGEAPGKTGAATPGGIYKLGLAGTELKVAALALINIAKS